MNSMDSRRLVSASLNDFRDVFSDEELRRVVTEIVDDWSLLVEDQDDDLVIEDINDNVTIIDLDDELTVTGSPVTYGDYDDDIDR